MSDEQELAEILSGEVVRNTNASTRALQPSVAVETSVDFSQWQVLPNNNFRPASKTRKQIPSGVYRIGADQMGPYLSMTRVITDDVIELPEASHMRVLDGIRTFWKRRDRYVSNGLIYKRGVLLWGPPGGGKTVTVLLLVQEIVKSHNGIVLLAEDPDMTVHVLRFLRQIEPNRPLIVILEDVDEIVNRHGEHQLLAILDGEHQTDNCVYLATTNYPDRLGARIVNRPSRFDERIKIGMPQASSRKAYLDKVASSVEESTIAKWVQETEGFSIAHLRELVVAVVCLDQEYDEVMCRLRNMQIRPKVEEDGFRKKGIGL